MTTAFSVNNLFGAPTTIVTHILELFFISRTFSDYFVHPCKINRGRSRQEEGAFEMIFFR